MEGLDLPLLVWRLRSTREAFLRSCSEEPRVSCIWTRAASRRPPRRTSRSVCRGKQQHQREQTVRTAVRRRDNTEPPSMCRRVPPSRDEDLSGGHDEDLLLCWSSDREELTCWMSLGRSAGAGPGGRARGRGQRSRVVAMVTSDPEGRGRWRLPRTAPPRLKPEIRT